MNRNTDGWIAVSEGPTGVWLFVGEENAVPADLPTYPDAGTGSIALHNGSNEVYLYHEEDGWKEFKLGGVSPEGTLLIVANGTYNVRDKASVSVNVQAVSNEDALIEGTISGAYVNNTATKVGRQALGFKSLITSVEMNAVKSIGNYSFYQDSALQSATFKNVLTIGESAFSSCTALKTVDISKATSIGDSAFSNLSNLETVIADEILTIEQRAFRSCYKLSDINLSKTTRISGDAFANCNLLKTVNVPECTSLNGFNHCTGLETIYAPKAQSIGNSAFVGCTGLTEVSLPSARQVMSNAFDSCTNLERVELGQSYDGYPYPSIGSACFQYCSSLETVVLPYDVRVVSLDNANVFNNTPIASGTGFIYVPDALVDSYKAATNWSTYAAQIKGLSELPA